MRKFNHIFGVICLLAIGASIPSYADEATDFCLSVNGVPKTYQSKDSEGSWGSAELCWIGNAAVGSWTLYRFLHPAIVEPLPEPGTVSVAGDFPVGTLTPLDQLLGFMSKNNLNLDAISVFLVRNGAEEDPAVVANTTHEYKIMEDNFGRTERR